MLDLYRDLHLQHLAINIQKPVRQNLIMGRCYEPSKICVPQLSLIKSLKYGRILGIALWWRTTIPAGAQAQLLGSVGTMCSAHGAFHDRSTYQGTALCKTPSVAWHFPVVARAFLEVTDPRGRKTHIDL